MASPYHRQLPYEHNAAGPSRTNVPFERPQSGPRTAYPSEHNYVENVDHHHSAPRRLDRPQVHYNSGGPDAYYPTPIPPQDRDQRNSRRPRETVWYPLQPHPVPSSYVPRRPSPPPVHSSHPWSYDSPTPQSAYPPYSEWRNASPTRSAWDERRAWDPVHDEHVHESPSTWQHTRPDSGSRLNDLLNPKTPSPPTDTWRWRPNEAVQEQHQGRNFVRPDTYTYDYRPPTQATYYDAHDGRTQYVEPGHYRSHYEEERVIRGRAQTYSDPAPRHNPNRHPAVQQTRPARPSALGDYKRQRYVSPPRQAEVAPASSPVWNRGHDKTWEWDRPREERERQRGYATREVLSNRGSFHSPGQIYSQYGYPNETPRTADELPYAVHTPSNSSRGPGGRDILNAAPVYSSSTAPLARPYPERPYDHGTRSNSDNGSEDEDSDVASSRASDAEIYNRAPTRDEQHHTNDALPQEGHGPNRPTTPVRPGSSVNMDQASASRQFEPSVANLRSIVGTPAGRSGVMSVHALLTPTPERPSTARSVVTTVEGLLGPRVSPTPSAKSSVLDIKSLLTDEPPPFRPPPSQPTPENRTEPGTSQVDLPITQETTTKETTDDARLPVDEASSLPPETIQVETPIAATPATLMETDAESRTLSGEHEIERSQAVSPRAPEPVSRKAAPPAEVVQAPHQNVILHPPQRVRPDAKMISDALKKVVLARNRLDKQSRDERVNPILMANLSLVSTPQSRTPTFPQTLVEEFRSKVLTIEDQELRMNARAVLAARFAEQRESLSEKVQRLRDEYLQHHRKWKAHCAELDAALKANAVEETTAATGRTTRRSAATHGDAVRSDLEMEQIIASLGNEDMTDPNQLAVRNVATIPDMISVEKGHVEYLFDDTNGFVEDPASFYDARSGFYDWTDEEKAIYLKKYAEFPKQFGQIASFLPNKTAKQCVLYYYLHKKRIIDFRAAVSSGHNRRRRGGRRGKQKSNALLVDIQGAEGEREKPAGGRRRRGGATGEGRGGRRAAAAAAQAAQNAQQTDQPAEGETRTRRRRGAAAVAAAKAAAQVRKEDEGEDGTPAAEDATEQQSEPAPPPKRQTRKPRRSTKPTESPAPAPATATETRFIDVNETLGRRKPAGNSSHWSDSDKEEFLKLLAQHGRNFKRIASSMPNKTTIQVQNFFKNHMVEMDLVRIADSAQGRSQSPDGSVPRDPFVNGSHIVTASNSAAPTPPVEPTPSTTPELAPPPLMSQGEELNQPVNNKPMKREGTAGPPGTGMMTLGEPGPRHIWMTERFPFVNANTPGASRPVAPMLGAQPQMLNQKAYMGVLHPTPFQDPVQRPMVLPQPPTPIGWQKTQAQMQDLAQGFSPPPMLNVHVHPGDKKPVRIQPAPSRTPGTTIAYPYPLQPSPHPGSPLLQHQHPHIHTHPHIMPRGSPVMPGPSRNPHELIHSPPRATEQGQKAPERSPPFTREPRDFAHT